MIGIDLGTTNSVMAVLDRNEPTIIPNSDGELLTPSVVSFTDAGPLIGTFAKRQERLAPGNTVKEVKREMGDAGWRFSYGRKKYKAEEISSLILRRLKRDAEAYLEDEVTDAVITVPAYFDHSQRKATEIAGKIAGLNVFGLISEPTAAALAHGINEPKYGLAGPPGSFGHKVMVIDLGGGTFDVSIVQIDGKEDFQVLSIDGDMNLGGVDWDSELVDHLQAQIQKKYEVDIGSDPKAMTTLRYEAEAAKKKLSDREHTEIILPFLTTRDGIPVSVNERLSRQEFEEMTSYLINELRAPFNAALMNQGIKLDEIEDVVLAGGATRMPAIREFFSVLTGKELITSDELADLAVAKGAAIYAGQISGQLKDLVLVDVLPLSLGLRLSDGRMDRLLERNTSLPCENSDHYTTIRDGQSQVRIEVFQGERLLAKDCINLGEFELNRLGGLRVRDNDIKVTFAVDINGILTVTAKHQIFGHSEKKEFTNVRDIPEEQVQEMIQDAREHEVEDMRAVYRINLINEMQRLADQVTEWVEEKRMNPRRERLRRRPARKLGKATQELLAKMVAVDTLIQELEKVHQDYEVLWTEIRIRLAKRIARRRHPHQPERIQEYL